MSTPGRVGGAGKSRRRERGERAERCAVVSLGVFLPETNEVLKRIEIKFQVL